MNEIKDIPLNLIDPSPYQHRRYFAKNKLVELANSIKRDGLIEPIVARPKNGRYELIAGERRWRASQLAEIDSLLARVIDVPDLQARRMCAAENLQREDLSAEEEIRAIVEIIDAELIEDDYYCLFGDDPILRVTRFLKKRESAEKRGYVNTFNNVIESVNIIMKGLPNPKDWKSFLHNDLPVLNKTDDDVKDLAARIKASKAKTLALQKLKERARKQFDDLQKQIEQTENEGGDLENVTIQAVLFGDDPVSIIEASARDIERAIIVESPENSSMDVHYSSDTPEWYTPKEIIESAISVLGEIDLDPCSNSLTHPNIPALKHHTKETNGLKQSWLGKVYMNPPYGDEIIHWVTKLKDEYETGNVTEAIALVPARTDTGWFKLLRAYPRCFVTGRLRFSKALEGAPFPSVVIYLGNRLKDFAKSFEDIGDIYILYQEQV